MNPPSTGPHIMPRATKLANRPSARPRSRAGNASVMMPSVVRHCRCPADALHRRATPQVRAAWSKCHMSDPMREDDHAIFEETNLAVQVAKAAEHDEEGAHGKQVIQDETHCIWSSPASRAFCMTGRATLTMLESSVAIKVMMRTVNKMAHLLGFLRHGRVRLDSCAPFPQKERVPTS